MKTTAKTDNFLKAIKKYANTQKSAMQEEVQQLKEKKIKSSEAKAKYDSEKLIKDKLEEKRNEQTSVLAKKTQEGQKNLFLERAKMTEDVFDRAEKKLMEYTKSGEYKKQLLDSAKEIAKVFGNESCVLYLKEDDLDSADAIKALFSEDVEIKADKSIKIGGIKGYCKSISIIADETLDSKLMMQKEWFIENAELKVL